MEIPTKGAYSYKLQILKRGNCTYTMRTKHWHFALPTL